MQHPLSSGAAPPRLAPPFPRRSPLTLLRVVAVVVGRGGWSGAGLCKGQGPSLPEGKSNHSLFPPSPPRENDDAANSLAPPAGPPSDPGTLACYTLHCTSLIPTVWMDDSAIWLPPCGAHDALRASSQCARGWTRSSSPTKAHSPTKLAPSTVLSRVRAPASGLCSQLGAGRTLYAVGCML